MHTHIGAYHILHGVDLDVPAGEVTMLLGRNGAGKTTTLRTIMGLWAASQGAVASTAGRSAAPRTTSRARPTAGFARPRSLRAASPTCPRTWASSPTSASPRTCCSPRAARARAEQLDRARLEWLFGLFPALKKFWLYPAGKLSGGQKQMLAIARAMIEPRRLLLIDEPSKGLAPAIVQNLIAALRELKRTATTVLLVEQNFQMAQALGDHVAVMDDGRVVHRGPMAELAADDALQQRLLGLSLAAHQ